MTAYVIFCNDRAQYVVMPESDDPRSNAEGYAKQKMAELRYEHRETLKHTANYEINNYGYVYFWHIREVRGEVRQ